MSTIHDERYVKLVDLLKQIRQNKSIKQVELAGELRKPQSYVAKIEGLERRLDVIELYDWLLALDQQPQEFFRAIGWFTEPEDDNNLSALPEPSSVKEHEHGVLQQLAWQGQVKEVLLEGVTVDDYLEVEEVICQIYEELNKPKPSKKNREAIYDALDYAINRLPNLNPSDIYHHLVYRLYLREYSKTQADRSWVRAGGEALELFVENHYGPILQPRGIVVKALLSNAAKAQALKEMGLSGKVGNSKLDVALYGLQDEGEALFGDRKVVFGGIHVKASLAERVSDDVPCSTAMMETGMISYLFTMDAKSFPPPQGDLVNRGELGTPEEPSDKRKYIEEQGQFDACFSYNLRTAPSHNTTPSGKKIYSSSFKIEEDPLSEHIIEAWRRFKSEL